MKITIEIKNEEHVISKEEVRRMINCSFMGMDY